MTQTTFRRLAASITLLIPVAADDAVTGGLGSVSATDCLTNIVGYNDYINTSGYGTIGSTGFLTWQAENSP